MQPHPMSDMTSTPAPAETTSRRRLGSYESYADAQAVVDRLSDAGFPVETVSIVGCDLRLVEQVTGRLTTARAAGVGAAGGAWWGVFVGLLLGLFTASFFAPLLVGLVVGAVFGAATGAIAHAGLRGKRDFSSVKTLGAGRYEILVDEAAADDAQRLVRA